jgi:hypothetical protein
LEALLHLFANFNKKHNAQIVFDPTYPDIDMTVFKECDWKHFYGDVHVAILPNDPLTQRSHSGFFIYMNMAPIVWFSKKQVAIETSVFGAEFVTMKQGLEALRGLWYKLRMMEVSISGPSYIYRDNMSVIHNTQ